jgi:hypothetical protein
MFQNFMGTTYLGKVGFRPWLAVRNMLQPYNMLAPRIGLAPVLQADREIHGPEGQAIMQRMRSEGTLMQQTPTAADIGTAKVTRASMKMIFTADDHVRAVAARSAENMLDEGIRSWNRGVFKGDMQKFKNFTELRQLQGPGNEGLAEQIAQLALSGDSAKIVQAKTLFGQKLAYETQPDYARYAQPHAFTNTLPGYAFGRFGTYCTAYRENIARGWQAAQGLGGKALFVSRFIVAGVGISLGLTAVGIQGMDFLPGYSALFGGSPQFAQIYSAAQAIRSGPGQQEAFREFARQTFSAIPGTLQYHYAQEFAAAASQGDLWKAFLALTTVPTLK